MSLHGRTVYAKSVLRESDVSQGPLQLLQDWVEDAVKQQLPDATAFALSTLDQNDFPHSRIVLLRELSQGTLVFYTNYLSEKGRDLERHPRAGATFFWPQLERQIRVRGEVVRVSLGMSDTYFASRPRESQLGAWASQQSERVESRIELDHAFQAAESRFQGGEVPRPPHWGGFALKPVHMEFWQGRPSRLHDRLSFVKTEQGAWDLHRLQP
ncbi:MAG: pyridoxamine 5'-phosphate oxidase [Bacteroidetes bacterium]|nr:pyridoxamine 5'-phosphate oxidase [Bacteroidota bacterium]MDA0902712.1 pyridoxamine 5'-phosphate oxidase [Bacteroidota bacterium]MDA1241793.1 pyridoxamine 5'-phosphate oxidase [Bacteroidota bacterium]